MKNNKKKIYDINNEKYRYKKYYDDKYKPYTDSWIHDENQYDDKIEEIHKNRQKIIDKLLNIKYPAQRSEQWFKDRETLISASDAGCVLGANKYESPYKFIIKKTFGSTFKSNEFCYHGKKYEQIATMIYENRMNVSVHEFGLVKSEKYSFLGASPDGIIGYYKADKKHYTDKVGRMIEIKCPFIRKIKCEGEIKDEIVPIYYWIQVQLQLQCCELDECDFWQCKFVEYEDETEFINDTKARQPWRSLENNLEKGCVIQLIPKSRKKDIEEGKYLDVIYEDAIFIYPESIELGPKKIFEWIENTKNDILINEKYKDFDFDKVIYWKLDNSFCTTINRDDEWFNEHLSVLEKMWNYVLFYRNNEEKKLEFKQFIDNLAYKSNEKIMNFIKNHYENNKLDIIEKQNVFDTNTNHYIHYKDVI
jgi:putative phage-type endonuclease